MQGPLICQTFTPNNNETRSKLVYWIFIFLLQGIEFLRKLTDGQVIDAQKTIPLKDNSGHYGNLFMGDICLNEQVKEQGYAYMRPAMSSNTLKSEEKSGAAIFGSKRNTGIF